MGAGRRNVNADNNGRRRRRKRNIRGNGTKIKNGKWKIIMEEEKK